MNHPENARPEPPDVIFFIAIRFAGGGEPSMYRVTSETHAQNTLTFLFNQYLQFARGTRKGMWGVAVQGQKTEFNIEQGVGVTNVTILQGIVDPNEIIEARVVTMARQHPKEPWQS